MMVVNHHPNKVGNDAAQSFIAPQFLLILTSIILVAEFFLMGSLGFAVEPYPSGSSLPPMEIRVELLPQHQTTLSSEMDARILRLGPREGRHFNSKETLVALNCAMEEAQLRRARAILNAAKSKAKVSTRLSRLKATSKLEEQVAKAEVAKAKAEMAIIQVKINRCKIPAPFSGRVVTLMARQHQYVKAGDPLMEILDEQNLEVVFLIPSWQRQRLSVGERFKVRIDETQRSYPAKISAFGAMIDSVSQSVKVFGTMIGQFPGLLPGMSGVAQFTSVIPVETPPTGNQNKMIPFP